MSILKIVYDNYTINHNGIIGSGWLYYQGSEIEEAFLQLIENKLLLSACSVILGDINVVKTSSVAEPKTKISFYFFGSYNNETVGSILLSVKFKSGLVQKVILPKSRFGSNGYFIKNKLRYHIHQLSSINWIKHNVKTFLLSFSNGNLLKEFVSIFSKIKFERNEFNLPKFFIIDHAMGGGANYFRDELISKKIKLGFDVCLLTFSLSELKYKLKLINAKGEKIVLKKESFEEIMSYVKQLNITQIYFNSFVAFPKPEFLITEIGLYANKIGVKITVPIHDFFPLCPSFNLLNSGGTFCNLPDQSVCDLCFPKINSPFVKMTSALDIKTWRKNWEKVFGLDTEIICFSKSSKEYVVKCYPLLEPKIKIIPHAEPILRKIDNEIKWSSSFITIGIVGNILHNKGLEIVKGLYSLIKTEKINFRIVVIGSIVGDFEKPWLVQTGKYAVEELPALFESYKIDFAFMPSIWPETFSYVAHEIKSTGLPIVTFNLGAQGDLAKSYEKGRVIDFGSPAEIAHQLSVFHQTLKKF